MLISIVDPVTANVLPAPIKFSVVAFPIEDPADDTPTVASPHATDAQEPPDLITCPAVP